MKWYHILKDVEIEDKTGNKYNPCPKDVLFYNLSKFQLTSIAKLHLTKQTILHSSNLFQTPKK